MNLRKLKPYYLPVGFCFVLLAMWDFKEKHILVGLFNLGFAILQFVLYAKTAKLPQDD